VLALAAVPLAAAATPVDSVVRIDRAMAAQVVPAGGHRSRIAFGASLVKLAQAGVIDRAKMQKLVPPGSPDGELAAALERPRAAPMHITALNARVYVDLLWPVGLANRMESNRESPLNGPQRDGFASTAGWTLGRAARGGAYFNSVAAVPLDPAQEALVTRIAQRTFRPCCDNSTFFQDCNHGAALLGLLALGAAQGLREDDLYREALAFNAFWFPAQYTQLAILFRLDRGTQWKDADPRLALSAQYSSGTGMKSNVIAPLQQRRVLRPPAGGSGGSCSA